MLFGVLTRLLSYVRKHIHWFCCPHCLTHTFDLRATNHHRPHRISSVRDNRAMCYTTCPGTQDRSQALPVQARERERLPRRSVSVYLKCPFVFFVAFKLCPFGRRLHSLCDVVLTDLFFTPSQMSWASTRTDTSPWPTRWTPRSPSWPATKVGFHLWPTNSRGKDRSVTIGMV